MVYYSELCYLNRPIKQMIELLQANGATRIELMLDGQHWQELAVKREEIVKLLCSYNIKYSVHPAAWDTNLTSELGQIRQVSFEHYVDCIRFASEIGASQVVIHPGFTAPPFNAALAKRRAANAIEKLADIAKPLGVCLALENVGGKKAMLYSQQEFEHLADSYENHVGLLLDIGHASMTGFDMPALIRNAGDRLLSVHLHDNDGTGDDHLPMGEGNIQFKPIFEALKAARNDCHLVLEYQNGTPLARLQKDKDYLESMMAK